MLLTNEKTKNAIMYAQEVLDQSEIFDNDKKKIPISIDAVTDYIEKSCNVVIEIREVSFEATYLKGRHERYNDDRVIIDFPSNLSSDWKRFVVLKELMHTLVDKDEDDFTPYGDVILDKLVSEGYIGALSNVGGYPPIQSEHAAEVAAIEVIYPMSLRRDDLTRIQGTNSNTTISQLALEYDAPVPITSTALHKGYIERISAVLSDPN